ncbi:MAG TPA: HAD-IA family hydrolase [Vicinamibacterales bacterium]|nr:HAD-IA family hydrolase [Vicinamibacterales bacterium]
MIPCAAVIFDFDGVVLDSETPEFESHRRVYEECGAELTREEWCGQIGAWTEGLEARWHAVLCERSSRPLDREAFELEKRRIFQEIVPREPMRGIRELLHALVAAGIPRAIASSGPASWVVPATERLALTALFGAIVTGDDVVRRKPAPDAYLEAARRLGADPARSVAVEDSGPGIAAARAAGMKTVAIPHPLTEGHDLGGADLRVAHAGELTIARLATLLG